MKKRKSTVISRKLSLKKHRTVKHRQCQQVDCDSDQNRIVVTFDKSVLYQQNYEHKSQSLQNYEPEAVVELALHQRNHCSDVL